MISESIGVRVWGVVALCLIGMTVYGGEKKIIGHGWDLLSVKPADVVANLDAWEQMPLDGISLMLHKPLPDGNVIGGRTVMLEPTWDRQDFADELVLIRQCASRNLKHNFLLALWAPRKRLAWDDDEAWTRFAHNVGILAWLAKEGQAKGIMVDAEDYPKTRQYFLQARDAPYAVTAAQARQRGAQIMTSIAAEYPDITLLSFWLLSQSPKYFNSDNPLAMAAEDGDLWPAFFNGMLDALPLGARMVDGDENAYRYTATQKDFYRACWRTQNAALKLVDPINHTKYQSQVQVGFGLYLDMYTNPSGSRWFFGEKDGSRLNHLRSNFAQALEVAHEYVWVYGEKMDWIKWTGTKREKNPTWEEQLPGFVSTLDRLRKPHRWAEQMVEHQRQAGTLTNLLKNGSCVPKKAEIQEPNQSDWLSTGCPNGWHAWQHEVEHPGVFKTEIEKGRGDDFSLCAVGVESGCFITTIPASPGQEFVVEAYAQGKSAQLTIRWKQVGKWDEPTFSDAEFEFSATESDGWRRAVGLVQVPEDVDELVLLLYVKQVEGEHTWFDEVGVYPVSGH